MLLVVPKVLSSHLVLLLPVLLKHQECLLVPRVLSLDKLLKDLVLQAFLRAQFQDLHQMDLEVPCNLVLLHNHLHRKDPELFRHHLVLKDLVPQAFLRAQFQDLHLLDSLLLKVLASLKDLTDPNSHFLLKDLQVQEVQVDSLVLLVHLKLHRHLVTLVTLVLVLLLKLHKHSLALVVLLRHLVHLVPLVLLVLLKHLVHLRHLVDLVPLALVVLLKLHKHSLALVVLLKLLLDQEGSVVPLKLLRHLVPLVPSVLVVLLRHHKPLIVSDLQAQVKDH